MRGLSAHINCSRARDPNDQFIHGLLGKFLPIQMLGFTLTTAVLLDATIVRMVIGPALLRLAGKWNWWPGWPGNRPSRSEGKRA
jgi:uncharacterized membrane protein YdfJ with MMPL/SSD domain